MILDGHLHIRGENDSPLELLDKMAEAGVDGGVIISEPPQGHSGLAPDPDSFERRIERLLQFAAASEHLYPLMWLDPMEDGVLDQVRQAKDAGVDGFKVICDRYYPGNDKAMAMFHAIAAVNKPILFHSGILWDGKPSAEFCRPAGFESLLKVQGLSFTLAHISWPWCDELIAVYGKFLNTETRKGSPRVEMYVDTTPGTPRIYRRDAITKLFTVGYDVRQNVIFGTDCVTDSYNIEWAKEWIATDQGLMKELGVEDMIEDVFCNNVLRFLGKLERSEDRTLPKQGE